MEVLDKRVSRILGQMRGIQNMVAEKRECTEILQQISAVKKAIDGLTKEIVNIYVDESIEGEKVKELKKVLDRAINL
ncbi:MAG: metal-sensitive transcriptional regulator [Weeksellaceae bacterium]